MQPGSDDYGSSSSLVDYAALLRRQWAVIVTCVVLGVAAAVAYVTVSPAAYVSSTAILVRATGIDSGDAVAGSRTSGSINLDTEAQIARSAKIAQVVKEQLNATESAQRLAGRLTVKVPPNSEVLVFDFLAQNSTLAQRGSTAFAEAYLNDRRATAEALKNGRRDGLQAQAVALNRQLDLAVTQISAAEAGSREQALAIASRSSIERQQSAVEAELATLELTLIDPGEIITPATPGVSDASTRALIAGVSGPFAGLLVGLGLALLLDRTSRRLHREDIERIAGAPVIAKLSTVQGSDRPVHLNRTTTFSPAAVVRLRNVLLRLLDPQPRTYLIADVGGSGRGEELSGSLAESLAESGASVAWVHLNNGRGPDYPLTASIRRIALGDQAAPATAQHISDELTQLTSQHQFVVLRTASPSRTPDAQTASQFVDVVLLVVDEKRTRRADLEDALEQVGSVGAALVRIVVVRSESRRGRLLARVHGLRRKPSRSVVVSRVQEPDNRPAESTSAPDATSETATGSPAPATPRTVDGNEDAILLVLPDRSVGERSIEEVAHKLGRRSNGSTSVETGAPQPSSGQP